MQIFIFLYKVALDGMFQYLDFGITKWKIKQCLKSVQLQKKAVRTDKCFTVLPLFVNCTVLVKGYSTGRYIS